MIKTVLKIKEYCHTCPLFEPKIDRMRFESIDGVTDEVGIRCELEEKCEVLKKHFCEFNMKHSECCGIW